MTINYFMEDKTFLDFVKYHFKTLKIISKNDILKFCRVNNHDQFYRINGRPSSQVNTQNYIVSFSPM